MVNVEVLPEAMEQYAKLPRVMQGRVTRVVERLEAWPDVSGVKWLTGDWKGHARIRTGDYRVVFRLLSDDELLVVRIGERGEIYFD